MPLVDYFKRILIIIIAILCIVVVVTTIMTFLGVSPMTFNPYMYFLIAMGGLSLFLSPVPLSIID